MYIGGEWIRESEKNIAVVNPYHGQLIAETPAASTAHILQAIEKAEQALGAMKHLPTHKRYAILQHVAIRLRNDRQRLASLLSAESGKPMRYALGEIDRAADTFLVAAEESKRLPREYLDLGWTAAGEGKEGLVRYFPAGIVAGITPFNFPLNLVAHKVAPAIAAGCPIILKPASSTPLSALELARILDETELPKGAFSVLPCDRKTGEILVTDARIAVLSFTGSPDVGWKMKEKAGKKKTVLELGGNAGVLLAPDAAIDEAVKRCLVGGFAYSGQVCIHAQRIFVHDSLFENFVTKMIQGVQQLRQGDPANPETDIASMIDEANAQRVEEWVNEALRQGATLLCGGKREGAFYAPTLLSGTHPGMKVHSEEVFGPVVVIEKYERFEEGLQKMNDSRFGLQCGVFTQQQAYIKQAFETLEVGGVILNDVPTFRVDHMPYGGIKDSGFGREGVKYAIRDYMEPRLLVY